MAERYRSAFTIGSFLTGDVAIVAGQYNKLGEYKVQAGETVSLGFEQAAGMDNAIGRIYGIFKDTAAAELKGKIRFSIWSPQDRPLKTMLELRTEALNTVETDRTKQTPFPERVEMITEDKKIVLEFLPDSVGNGTLDKETSKLIMDITQGIA